MSRGLGRYARPRRVGRAPQLFLELELRLLPGQSEFRLLAAGLLRINLAPFVRWGVVAHEIGHNFGGRR